MGGSAGPRSAALAARFADAYNTAFPTLDDVKRRKARIDEACERAHRSPIPFSIMTGVLIGVDASDVRERARHLTHKMGGDAGAFLDSPPEGWIVGTIE